VGASGSKTKLAIDELVLAGHSFGSATMTQTANLLGDDAQPKAMLLMDLWCFPLLDDIQSEKIKFRCPV